MVVVVAGVTEAPGVATAVEMRVQWGRKTAGLLSVHVASSPPFLPPPSLTHWGWGGHLVCVCVCFWVRDIVVC